MPFAQWRQWLNPVRLSPRRRRPIRTRRPRLEQLEDRVVPAVQSDLTVLSASLGSQTAVVGDGFQLPVTYTVKNQGTFAPSQTWDDAFYLSSKQTLDSTAVLVGFNYRFDELPLAVGGTYTASTTLTVPNTTLSGNQFLLIVTDAHNSANESNTNNNTLAEPIQLTTPNVDLAVSNPSVSSTSLVAGNGAGVTVGWTVTNNGNVAAGATWFDSVYLSSKTTYDSTAVFVGTFKASSTLAAGASYSQSKTVPIPNTALSGNQHLLIVANSDGGQSETDAASDTNDTRALGVSISAPSNVDLQVVSKSLSAPTAATLGQTIPVSWTVKNAGSGTASGTWSDSVYTSPTATFNASTAHLVRSFTAPAPLAAGASYTQSQNVTLPASSSGDGFLIVVTNDGNTQAESNTGNDAASVAISLSEPNLAITAFSAPSTANLGDTVTLTWSVKNTSAVAAPVTWSDAVYISSSSTFDSTAQYVTSFRAPFAGALGAGASYNQSEQVTLPYTQTGSRFLLLVADDGGSLPVSGQTPVVASSAITLGQPDLTVTLNAPPSAAVLGQAFNLSWTVSNPSSVNANAGWEDVVFISSSANLDPTTVTQVAFVQAPHSLAAGASYTQNTNVTLPSMPAGNYFLFVVADRFNAQGKSNESIDNVASHALAVTGPDLSVQINSASSSVVAGDGNRIALSWTVTNNSATADAVATWRDTVYLSSTPTLDTSNKSTTWPLGSYDEPITGPLNAGASYSNGANVLVPNLPAAGTFYLFVVTNTSTFTDYYYQSQPQAVTNTTDETASASVNVTLPNVTLNVLSASVDSSTVTAGFSVDLTWLVQNQGTDAARADWNDQIYLSPHQTLDGSAKLIQSVQYQGTSNPVAPNTTYKQTNPIIIPGSASGSEYLLIVPDGDQGQTATTSTFALPITVNPPDVKLATAITSAPTTVSVGQPVSVSWTVTNNGTVTTTASSWVDNVYLSRSPTFDSTATYVTSAYLYNYSGSQGLPLAPGGSYSQTATFTVPQYFTPGSYYLFVRADNTSYQDTTPPQGQSDASQSVAGLAVTVTSTSTTDVDLVVTSASAPTSATLGSSIAVSYTVKNQGVDPTGNAWQDAVYLSNTPGLGGNAAYLTTFNNPSSLAGGASYTANETIDLPTYTSPGPRYLVFVTNNGAYYYSNSGAQPEVNTQNDSYAVPITLSAPDLAVTNATVTGAAVEGTQVQVSWTVKNRGSVTATGTGYQNNWQDAVYLSDTPTYDPSRALFVATFTSPTSSLAAGGSYTTSEYVTLPATTLGNRYLLVVTDAYSSVGDTDRSDNIGAAAVTLTAPNLVISKVSVTPTTAEVGNAGTFNLSWTVTNNSSLSAPGSWDDAVYLSASPIFDLSTVTLLTSQAAPHALAGNASYTTSVANVAVPEVPPGTYYVFFEANQEFAEPQSNNQFGSPIQPEANAADNLASVQIALAEPNVNLTVGNTRVASTSLVDGQTVNVSFTVTNAGGETAQTSWNDAVYLSSSSTFDPNTAQRLTATSLTSPSPLAANGSYTQAPNVTIPNALTAGTYYLFYVTDVGRTQGETNFADDVSSPIQITVHSPDLSISPNSPPSAAKLNDIVSVSWTVTNVSTQYAAYGNWNDAVYLSPNKTVDSSAILLATKLRSNSSAPLAAGGSYTQTASITIPNGATGNEYLLFVTDAFNAQGDANRNNNVVASAITLSAPQVNLQVVPGTVLAPGSVNVGGSARLSWSVQNSGTDPANGPWQDNVYLSTSNTFNAKTATLLGRDSAPAPSLPLAAGSSYIQQNVSVPIPSTLSTGNYFLFVVTNANKGQAETNTGDDVSAAVAITVTAPDLVVTGITVPTAATYGGSISVSWTVQNNGNGAASGTWYDAVYLSTTPDLTGQTEQIGTFSEGRTLAVNNSYTDNQTISLGGYNSYAISQPPLTGPLYVVVVTNYYQTFSDSFDSIVESNYNNDTRASSQVTLSAPDLSITATAPSSAKLNDTIPVSWTVTNASQTTAAPASWYDAVYLSSSPTYNYSTSTQLNSEYVDNSAAPLVAGGKYTQNVNVTIPNGATGQEYLIFVADAYDDQPDTNLANNTVVVPITLAQPQVNLQVIPGSVTAPNTADVNSSIDVSWSVQNTGTDAANATWQDAVYVSTKNTFDASAQLLDSISPYGSVPLAGGGSYNQTDFVYIPSSLAAGTYYLYVKANNDNSQSETNTGDNLSAPIAITIGAPDLQVTSVTAPGSAVYGSTISLSWTGKNTGTDTISGNWFDTVYASSTPDLSGTTVLLGSFYENQTLAANATYTDSQNVTLTTSPPSPGTFYIVVKADAFQDVAESSYTNNTDASAAVTVNAPQLSISVVSAPTSAKLNDTASVSWTVTNIGQYAANENWVDGVYLSSNGTTFDRTSATLLTSVNISNSGAPLAPGSGYSQPESANITFPSTEPTGPLYLWFVTDINGAQAQTDRSKDAVASAITLSVPNVDLQIVSGSVTAPSSANGNTSITVGWSVLNGGTDPANGPWQDYVYISNKSTFDSSARSLGSYSAPGLPLGAGGSYNQSASVFLPSNLTPGSYYLYVVANGNVVVNSGSGQSETNTGNNVSAALPITILLPDLQVTSVTAPVSGTYGSTVSVSWTVKNTGPGSTPNYWYDAVYVSQSQTFDSTAQLLDYFYESHNVSQNGTYTDTQNVSLSGYGLSTPPLTGPEYILVVANAFHYLTESDFTNNAGASNQITLSAPDLTVTTATAPASGVIGGSISVSWTVQNASTTVNAPGSWYDYVYISPDNTLDSNAQYVAAFTAPQTLNAGASYTQTQKIYLPSTNTGPQYLLFVANGDNGQPETSLANDVYAVAINISAADLTVTGVVTPTSISLGQPATVSWTVKNTGSGSADGSWSDAVYVSTRQTLDASAIYLTSVGVGNNAPLANGASYTQSAQVDMPAGLPSGNYYLLVQTNSDGGQLEINTSNNVGASSAFTLFGPDLTLTSVSVPSSANFGQTITMSWTVQNSGSSPASTDWNDAVYFSSSSTFDGTAQRIATVPVGGNSPLAAGASYTQSAQVTLPLTAKSVNGTYYLYVVANDGRIQGETVFNNDTSTSQAIALTLPPLPDLVVTAITAPPTAFDGTGVNVTWTDQNNGTAAATGPWTDQVYYSTSSTGSNPVYLGSFTFNGSVAAGASVQQTHAVTLPTSTGTIWFVVVADTDQGANEGPNNGNNSGVSANSLDVTQAPQPDLVVTSITPPSNGVLSGTSVPITFVVKNQGNAPTSVPVWQDWVILSQDPTLAQHYAPNAAVGYDQILNNQPVILGFDNPSFLDVGQSYSQTVDVPLPVSAQGTWYVYVVPDGTGSHHPFAMAEASRTDKLALSAGFNVALTPPPDLAVTSVQAPAQNFSGSAMNVTWTVTNQGTGPTVATSWTDKVYESTKSTLDASATLLGSFPEQGGLAAGTSYTDTEPVDLPVGVSGSFYIFVQTDAYGDVFENGLTANDVAATSAAVTVNLTPPPDLTPVVTAPATAQASHALTFTYTVTNNGAGGTPNTYWNDAYYLSPTATYNAGTAVYLGSQTVTGGLDAGANYTSSFTTTLPNGLSGTYYVIVATDSGNQVFELNNSNKMAASAAIQVASMPADLVVSSAAGPATGASGGAVLLTWTVLNQGTGDSAVTTWQDAVYADTNSSLTGNAVYLGSFAHNGLLNVNGTYTQSQLVTLPLSLASGSYNLFVVANSSNDVYETATNNNTSAAIPITITQQLADLQTAAVTGPTTTASGASVTVNWTVTNNGTATTNANFWNDDVWISTKTTLGSGGTDVFLGSVQHTNALGQGASYPGTLTANLPQNLAAGTYYFIVVSDSGNRVYESSKTNNTVAAGSATTVSSAPVADLSVASITAPATATSGATIALSWQVTNSGAGTGNVPITDSVYLSLDQVLDPTDRYVGSVVQNGGLANGASYTQNATLQLPSGLAGTFYVFVVTNSTNSVYERSLTNNTNYDTTTVLLQLPPPADLVAGTVTIPANAIAGQNISITYQVTNNGTNAANGNWYDALYLSPTPTWNVNDPLLGRVYESQNLAPGASYTGTLTAPLPALAPGSYYVIVRSNILNTLPEVTLANNLNASLTQSSIDAPALTLGTPTTGTLTQGQSAFYKVVVGAGQTLRFSFQGGTGTFNELYVSYGTMPTRGQFDYRYQVLAANQQITIPTTQAGSYYVLAYGAVVPGSSSPENYTITASLVPFSIQAVQPGTVGTGPVTVEIDGAKFDNGTTFQLLAGNTVIQAQQVTLQDSSTAFVKFDLTSAATGTYTVQATHADGTKTQLGQALSVVAAAPANLQLYLSVPRGVLPNAQSELTVNYVNQGNTDLLAPLIELTATNALLKFSGAGAFSANPLWFLGTSANGPAGILRPGESGQITIPFQAQGGAGHTIHFSAQLADDTQAMDWAGQKSALQPADFSAAAWNGVFSNFVANVGGTVASYHAALAADATYLGQLGRPTYNVLDLLTFEINKANAAYTATTLASATDDSLPTPGIPLSFQRTFQQAISGRYSQGMLGYGWTTNWDYSATTDSSGNVTIGHAGTSVVFLKQADGSFQPDTGDRGALTLTNGAFRLVQTDGTVVQFNTNGTLNYVQDANGNRITAAYNVGGQLVSLTASNGESFTLAYNSQGRLATLTDSNGLTETYGYDATGNFLTSVTDRFGTTTYSYVTGQSAAQNNALAQIAFADGTHVFYTYDSQGRLTDQHRDGGALDETFSYLSPGGYVATDGNGDRTTILFNLNGAAAETIDALGNVTRYLYDASENLTEVDGPLGTKYTYQYDAAGNLVRVTDPLGNTTQYSYDANHNLTGYTDAKGNTTSYAYDAANDLMSVTYADSSQQKYTYNPLGEAIQYVNARGHAVGYTYNAQGLVTKESFANNTSSTFTYDSRGNLLTAKDASGNVTTFTYGDPRNPDFLTQVAYPDGTSLQFSYNNAGQRTQSVDQTGFTVNYTYDSVGRLSKLTDGSGNLIVQYSYDKAGRLSQKDLGNGTRSTYGYDADGHLLQITNLAADHKTINSFDTYTYDALGNVLTDTSQDGKWTYTYDADGQLTGAVFASANTNVLPNQNIQYAYDPAGNRISQTINGVSTSYTVNNLNEYLTATTTGVGTTTYQYDADGNRISATDPSSNKTTYTFNDQNQLTGVSGPGLTASYFYDPLGNRVSQTVNGTTTNFQIDPTGLANVVASYSGTGVYANSGLQAHYTYGTGLVSQVSGTGVAAYYDFNLTGNTVGLTNGTGVYADRYSYLPFGQTITISAQVANPFTTGGQFGVSGDGSGMLNLHYREYDPATGAFLSNDPLGIGGGDPNVRRYAGNDPLTAVDPAGLCSITIGAQGGAGIGGGVSRTFNSDGSVYVNYSLGVTTPGVTVVSFSTGDASEGFSLSASAALGNGFASAGGSWNPYDFGYQAGYTGDAGYAALHSLDGNFNIGFQPGGASAYAQYSVKEYGPDKSRSFPCPPIGQPPTPPSTAGQGGASADVDQNNPVDPNYIFGPAGFGTPNYVSANQVLPYTILFENQPTAGFPAQQVVITQQLDPGLNWAAFRLGSFGFGGKVYAVPANRSFYQTRLDLTKTNGFYVDVTATIDVSTGITSWTFTTIDPTTGQKPIDPTVGFLPPDNSKGIGAGFVSYSILPAKRDTTGTVIYAQATVTFDNQPPLNTPQIFNTIDTSVGLNSAVSPLPAFQATPGFTVSWSGNDVNVGSAIGGFTINVSDNGAAFVAWLQNTTLTSAMYPGVAGHTYRFYSLASDNTGDTQTVPGAIQSTAVVADHIVLQAPAQAIGGGKFTVVADAVSPDGKLDTHYNGSLALALGTGPAGGSLSGVTIVQVQNGVATFTNLSLSAVGNYTLVAASSTDLLGTSAAITVAPTTGFTITAVSSATAGNAFNVTVTAVGPHNVPDPTYLGTVHFASTDLQALLPPDYTFLPGDKGVKTFSITLGTAGARTLTVSDVTLKTARGVSSAVTVGPAGAATLKVTGFPTSDVTGTVQNFTVTAYDAYGNVATGYSGTVHFTSSDPSQAKSLPADYTFVAATDKGVHKFPATLVTTGAQSLTATDTATSTITGSETGIQVVSAATQLSVTGLPTTPVTAGTSFTFTVAALTAKGQADALFGDTVHFTSSDPHAVLPADYTFLPGDKGTKSFSFTFKTAGVPTITVTDVTRPKIKSATGKATVTPAGAATLKVTGFPATDVSGTGESFVVTAYDGYGNVATGYTGTVHITSSDTSNPTLPADYTFLATDKGVHKFPATLIGTGPQSITATDTTTSTITGTESGIQVVSAATQLRITGLLTTPQTAGNSVTFTVTALTAKAQADARFGDTIHFTSSDPHAVLPADYTFLPGDQGAHSFSVTFKTAGVPTITVTDVTRPKIKGATGKATVSPAGAASLKVSGFPTPDVTGAVQNFVVTALDAYGNVATGYAGTVHFTSSDPSNPSLPADYTFVAATDKGVHKFPATLVGTGPQSLTATDKANAAITGTESGIRVVSPATQLSITGLPTTPQTTGTSFTFSVTALNAKGQADTLFGDTVHFTSSDPHAVLPADYTFLAGDNGTHSFSITLETAGTPTFTVTDLTRPTVKSAAGKLAVNPGQAVTLQVSGFPSLVEAGVLHNLAVTALDAYGNVATGYTGTIHFTSSDSAQGITLPQDYKFLATDKGVHVFQAALETTQGTQTLTATDTTTASITGTETNLAVTNLSAAITGPGGSTAVVGVPGQPLAFTVTAGGANEPAGTVYTYHIDWFGNGKNVQPVTGGSSVTVSNTYPATGPFLVKVTVTDAAGNTSPQAATLPVSIVSATIEADPTNSAQSDLFVGGTTGNDTITLTPAASDTTGTQITLTVNGQSAGTFPPTGQTLGLIVVYGQAGNDTIQEVANAGGVKVAVPAIVLAGPGNSTLSAAGSSATNVLVGGSGNDSLIGGAGRDILIGGGGAAVLHAGAGDDILIAGSTGYDANVVALEAIAQEWARTDRTYHQRVQDLFGNGSGGQNLAYVLNSQTVAKHTVISQLFGGPGQDWFWLSDSGATGDKLTGFTNGEVETFE